MCRSEVSLGAFRGAAFPKVSLDGPNPGGTSTPNPQNRSGGSLGGRRSVRDPSVQFGIFFREEAKMAE